MTEQTDAQLIAAYSASRDETAFGEIVSRHGPMVYRACLGLVGDPHEAEDCSQAVFVVLARKARTLGRSEGLAAWLYGVARRVCLHAVRDRANRARREEVAAMPREKNPEAAVAMIGDGLRELVYLELSTLSKAERQAVILRHLEGLSVRDAARVAGCPQGTLGRRASEGLARLRERLATRGQALGAAPLAGWLEAEAARAVPETLLPSILAVSKLAAVGVAAGTAGLSVVLPGAASAKVGASATAGAKALYLAEGVMRMMVWAKVKLIMAVSVAAMLAAAAVPLVGALVRAGEPAAHPPAPAPVADKPASDPAAGKTRDDLLMRASVSAHNPQMVNSFLSGKMPIMVMATTANNPIVGDATANYFVLDAAATDLDFEIAFEVRLPDHPDASSAPTCGLLVGLLDRDAKDIDQKLNKQGGDPFESGDAVLGIVFSLEKKVLVCGGSGVAAVKLTPDSSKPHKMRLVVVGGQGHAFFDGQSIWSGELAAQRMVPIVRVCHGAIARISDVRFDALLNGPRKSITESGGVEVKLLLRDAAGQPVPGILLNCMEVWKGKEADARQVGSGFQTRPVRSAPSDAEGLVTVALNKNALPGSQRRLIVKPDNKGVQADIKDIPLEGMDGKTIEKAVTLTRTVGPESQAPGQEGTVSGTVTDGQKVPAGKLTVKLVSLKDFEPYAKSIPQCPNRALQFVGKDRKALVGKDGRFSFEKLAPGEYVMGLLLDHGDMMELPPQQGKLPPYATRLTVNSKSSLVDITTNKQGLVVPDPVRVTVRSGEKAEITLQMRKQGDVRTDRGNPPAGKPPAPASGPGPVEVF